ncbi:MAG: protein kinase [Planctomycetes bacterium]|nr:protein kinase [Planctomycetota bacterium]
MLAHVVVCPACDASFKGESSLTEGAAVAKCPKCGEAVSLNAADATSASEASPSEFPETASVVAGVGASDAPTDGTLAAPSGPPSSAEYPFLAAPQKPDELGRLGQYRVLGVLGAGGMGVVFRAEDPVLRRQIALKVMLPQYASHPAAKARFLREARSQAAVEHNHIIAIYQVAEERDIAYITMPFLKGQTLADALKANPNVPVGEAVRIAREMAEGLAAAHENGLKITKS